MIVKKTEINLNWIIFRYEFVHWSITFLTWLTCLNCKGVSSDADASKKGGGALIKGTDCTLPSLVG